MNENQYKRIADEYLREYGAQLRRELEGIEQQPIQLGVISLDRRVKREITALKRPRYLRYAGLIAACLAIALLTPFVLRNYPNWVGAPVSSSGSPSVSEPSDPSSGSPSVSAPSDSSSGSPSAPAPSNPYEIIPLSFSLPRQFNVESVEQDVERTIYYLDDTKLDNVIITMERSGDLSRYDTLTEISVGGGSAFGSSGNGYNLLAFRDEDSDILYVLTCRYDINTLVLLGKSIMI